LKYEINLNGEKKAESALTKCGRWGGGGGDFNVVLEEPIEVNAGVKIEIKSWNALSLSASSSVRINLGHPGSSYATFTNSDMGLFTLERSDSC